MSVYRQGFGGRDPVRVAALLSVALVACGSPGSVELPRDRAAHPWPMFRGDPLHASAFPDRPTPQWRVRWSVELGERIDASAVIDESGRMLVATRRGLVAAFDVETGNPAGRLRLPGGMWSSPALIGGVMVAACDDGVIRGIDLSDLKVAWERRAPAKTFSGITVFESQAWLTSGSALLAVDPFSGKIARKLPLPAASFTAPAIDPKRRVAVVGDRGGHVVAVSTADGRRLWTADTSPGANNDGSAAISGDIVVLGSNDGTAYAFHVDTGKLMWKVHGGEWMVSTPAIYDGVAYIGDDGGVLRALSIADGTQRWAAQVGDDIGASPAVVGELIVHGAHDSKIHAHRFDGTSLAPIDAGGKIYASPAISSKGVIVLATQQGRVLAVE